MSSIHVIFDPDDRISSNPEQDKRAGIKVAKMAIPDDLDGVDIYNVARKVCELLLEQIPKS